jgi:outer membrane protein assembly factor BamA
VVRISVALPCTIALFTLLPITALGQQTTPSTGSAGTQSNGKDKEEPTGGIRGWVQKKWEQFDRFADEDEARFFPQAGIIVAGSALSAGGGYRAPRIGGSRFGAETSAMFSYRGYELYRLRLGVLDTRNRTLNLRPADAKAASLFNDSADKRRGFALYADVSYRDYPQHTFFGIGPDSRGEDRSDYRLYGASYDAVVQAQLTPRLALSGRVGVLNLGIGTGTNDRRPNVGTIFDPTTAPGLDDQPLFFTLGLAAAFDARDLPGDPHAGSFLGLVWWRADGRESDRYDFRRIVLDARHYVMPFTRRGVVALRGLLTSDLVSDGAEVPFYLQHTLGGTETLRGFPGYRFRDRAVAHVSAEYRWEVHPMVEVAPFFDAGLVAPGFSKLRMNELEVSQGIGLRVKRRNRVLFRIDWGISREEQRFSFGTGPLF